MIDGYNEREVLRRLISKRSQGISLTEEETKQILELIDSLPPLSGVFCGFHHRTPQEAVIQGVLEDGIEKNWCKTCLLAVYAHC